MSLPQPADRKLTPKEAAAHIEVSVTTIREYIRKGALRVLRRGNGPCARIFIRESDLRELFKADN